MTGQKETECSVPEGNHCSTSGAAQGGGVVLSLESVVSGFSRQLGVRSPRLWVVRSGWWGNARACPSLNVIILSEEALVGYSAVAQSFLMAHECAHLRYDMKGVVLAGLLLLFGIGVVCVRWLLPGLLLLACLVVLFWNLVRQNEVIADLVGDRLAGEDAFGVYQKESQRDVTAW